MKRNESSLKAYDKPGDRIRLHRQVSKLPVVVVEGVSDERFCLHVLDVDSVDIFVVGTRNVVIETAKELAALNFANAACVIDRDFDRFVETVEPSLPLLVPYDNADLEGMLVMSDAFARMVSELGSGAKIEKFGGVGQVRNHVVRQSCAVASIRRANFEQGWGVVFDRVEVGDKLKGKDLALDTRALADALLSTLDHPRSVTQGEVLNATASDPIDCPSTGDRMIRGRDALSVVGAMLRRLIGSLKSHETTSTHLERIIRLTVDRADIERTVWWARLTSNLAGSPVVP